jgi:hypothetical protein
MLLLVDPASGGEFPRNLIPKCRRPLAAVATMLLIAQIQPTLASASMVWELTPSAQQNGRWILGDSALLPGPNLEARTYTSFGFTNTRYLFALNFNLSSLSNNKVHTAKLQVSQLITGGSGTGTISIYGSKGTGDIPEEHFLTLPPGSNLIASLVLDSSGLKSFDLTPAVQNAVDNAWQDFLITVRFAGGKATYNRIGVQTGFTPTELTWRGNGSQPDPRLIITVPEPSTHLLALLGCAGLVVHVLRYSRAGSLLN